MYWNPHTKEPKEDAYRLTLTWDVLKLTKISNLYHKNIRLTLTWDVLKLLQMYS